MHYQQCIIQRRFVAANVGMWAAGCSNTRMLANRQLQFMLNVCTLGVQRLRWPADVLDACKAQPQWWLVLHMLGLSPHMKLTTVCHATHDDGFMSLCHASYMQEVLLQ